MIWFAKLSAASSGRLIRAYFTENSPDRAAGEELKPDSSGRLTAYYTGRDSRATWRADMPFAVSRALGIDPTRPPTNEALDRLFEAKRADSGERWSKGPRKISAFDFQTAPHKSVTLAAEFAKTPAEAAAIWHAMDRANDATMRLIARDLGWARRGDGGQDGAERGAVGWVSFRHFTARPTLTVQDGPDGITYLAEVPVPGDPQAHIHNAFFNLVVTDEGHVGSLDTKQLSRRIYTYGAFYQAVLADELRKLGARLGYDKSEKAIVVLAVPGNASEFFSKGHKAVVVKAKKLAKRQGLNWHDLSADRKFGLLAATASRTRLSNRLRKNA